MQTKRAQNFNHWRHHISAAASSSQSAAAYCRSHNLSLASFYVWRRKLANSGKLAVIASNPFARVEVLRELGPCLPDPKWLAEFLSHFSKVGAQ